MADYRTMKTLLEQSESISAIVVEMEQFIEDEGNGAIDERAGQLRDVLNAMLKTLEGRGSE